MHSQLLLCVDENVESEQSFHDGAFASTRLVAAIKLGKKPTQLRATSRNSTSSLRHMLGTDCSERP